MGESEEALESEGAIVEEERKPKIARIPVAPTAREWDDHMTHHAEFRDWCPWCVQGKGISYQHRQAKEEDEKLGVTVSMDWTFVNSVEDDSGETGPPTLVLHDNSTIAIWASARESKEITEDLVEWACSNLKDAGYTGTRITLKSDGEEGMKSLKSRIALKRQCETGIVHTPVRESKANGAMEASIRSWKGQYRTLRLYLEHRIKSKVPYGHPLLTWLSVWASEVINKFRPRNGRTAYELMTGHRVKHLVVGFGEKIMAQFTADKGAKNDHDSRWMDAFFLGVETASGSYLVANENGIFKIANIRRNTSESSFDAEILTRVSVTHSDFVSNGAATSSRAPVVVSAPVHMPDAERNVPVPRRLMLRQTDFAKFGFTAGCAGCEWYTHKIGHSKNHTEDCRTRIEAAVAESDDGKTRLDKNKDRIDHAVAQILVAHPEWGLETTATGSVPEAKEGEKQDETIGLQEIPARDDVETFVEPDTLITAMEDETQLEDRARTRTETRLRTPERAPATRRVSTDEGPLPYPKTRRLSEDAMETEVDDSALMEASIDALSAQDILILDKIVKGADIMEVFSPARVNELAVKFGLIAGASLDLTNGFDFDKKEDRDRCWKIVIHDKPQVLVGSPPCTMFSMLQELNIAVHGKDEAWMKKFEEQKAKATRHIEFCCELYRYQLSQRRHFLHEHPWSARSWKLSCIEDLLIDSRVLLAHGDMCRFGMTSHIDKPSGERGPVKKPTGFMTSSWCIYDELDKRCHAGLGHVHVPLVAGRASAAQVYPDDLCRAICRGIAKQKTYDNGIACIHSRVLGTAQLSSLIESAGCSRPVGEWPDHYIDPMHEPDGGDDRTHRRKQDGASGLKELIAGLDMRCGVLPTAWDDANSNAALLPGLVVEARALEMKYFRDMEVYEVVSRSELDRTGGKLIDTRWIDTNKADELNPEYRSRLVGREFNDGKDDSLYASTPPLESLRLVVSWAATIAKSGSRHDHELMINDVRRAYFYAKASRDLFVEIPDEDPRKKPGLVGRLKLCLYGTRDAAKSWQKTLTEHLVKIGFKRGRGHISVFHHPERGIKTLVHGDDYCSAGKRTDLDWLQAELEKAYELKTQRVSSRQGASVEGKVLNRIVRWTKEGYELEGDPRHAELVVEKLGLENATPLSSPGVDTPEPEEGDSNDEELNPSDSSTYRQIAARCNYMAADRPELQFSVKECCREMSRPTKSSWEKLVRIGRYLKGQPRLVWRYPLQLMPCSIDVYVDSNWAGCRRTRKSTSGGIALLGTHVIKSWSKTQAVIAKSSAEAELFGVVRGSTEGLGLITLCGDLGSIVKIRVHLDATAAKGIVEREGLGKIRHLDVDILWIQEQQARARLPLIKVLGTLNPADLMTKHLARADILKNLKIAGLVELDGRAEKAAQLHSVVATLDKMEDLVEQGTAGHDPDCWEKRGEDGTWIRRHTNPRLALFTPFRVPRGPPKSAHLGMVRRTVGRFVNGDQFDVEDDWTSGSQAHRFLRDGWTGRTIFSVRS